MTGPGSGRLAAFCVLHMLLVALTAVVLTLQAPAAGTSFYIALSLDWKSSAYLLLSLDLWRSTLDEETLGW